MLTCFLRQPDQEMSEESETVAGDDFQLLKHSLGKPGEGSFLWAIYSFEKESVVQAPERKTWRSLRGMLPGEAHTSVPLSPEPHLALPFLFLRFTMEVIAKILGMTVSMWKLWLSSHPLPSCPALAYNHSLSLLKLMISQSVVWGSLPTCHPDPFRGSVRSQLFY